MMWAILHFEGGKINSSKVISELCLVLVVRNFHVYFFQQKNVYVYHPYRGKLYLSMHSYIFIDIVQDDRGKLT